jgi:fructan beta-fructosidase
MLATRSFRIPLLCVTFVTPKSFGMKITGSWLLRLEIPILFFASPDLKHWEQSGSFGNGFGSTIGVWEMPDLFKLPLGKDGESRWVLIVGVGSGGPAGGSGTQYFIGDFNGKTFVSENHRDTILWTDYGSDYYAPQSWSNEPNGRRIMLGWMSNWQYAREVPSDGWRGMFSLPRELSLAATTEGVRLVHKPVPELEALRVKGQRWQNQTMPSGENLLAGLTGDVFEIIVEFQDHPAVNSFGLRVRQGGGESTTIGYNSRSQEVFIDRTRSGTKRIS